MLVLPDLTLASVFEVNLVLNAVADAKLNFFQI